MAEFMAESVVLDGGMAGRNRPCPTAEFPGGKGGGAYKFSDPGGLIILTDAKGISEEQKQRMSSQLLRTEGS